MSYILPKATVTKKIIDLFVNFLRTKFATSRLYENVKITDRFSLTSAQIPTIIVRNTSNSQRRIDFTDYIEPIFAQSELIPLTADNNLVGNNVQRVNLPATVDWNPVRPFDLSILLPSGSDINTVILTSGTAPYDTTTNTTGIIITIPSASSFTPTSLVYGADLAIVDGTPSPIISGANYNFSIGLSLNQEQFYLMYSGTGISGTNSIPIYGDDYIINPSGIQSGVAIKVSDVLFAGDQYQLNLYSSPRYIADRFGGIYDSTLSFDCYAETTIEAQELADLTERFLVEKKFDIENISGVHLTSWSMGSQSEEPHLSNYIFKCTINCECWIEWFDIRSIGIVSGVTSNVMPIGTYWTNYPLSGTPLEPHVIISTNYLTFSGSVTVPLNIVTTPSGIDNVYSGSTINTGHYPPLGVGISGSGWYQSGTNLIFTNGTYSNFNVASLANQIPGSGIAFFVNYNYSGSRLVDPSGLYNHQIGYTPVGVSTSRGINSSINTPNFPIAPPSILDSNSNNGIIS